MPQSQSLPSTPSRTVIPQAVQAQLAVAAQRGDTAARNRLVTSNQGLVKSIAREFTNRGVAFEDLVQEGTLGLMTSVDKFDRARGTFATCASLWIRQAIGRACENQGSIDSYGARIPAKVLYVMPKMRRSSDALRLKLGRTPTPVELAAECGVSERTAKDALDWMANLTVRAAQSEESKELQMSTIASPSADPSDQIAGESSAQLLTAMVSRLPERERSFLSEHYGLDGNGHRTMAEIASGWGCDLKELKRVQSAAMRRLRGDKDLVVLSDDPTLVPAPARAQAKSRPVTRKPAVAVELTCSHLKEGVQLREIPFVGVSRVDDRALTGRVDGVWWMVSRADVSQPFGILVDIGDEEMIPMAQAWRIADAEQRRTLSRIAASMPVEHVEHCAACCG